MRIDQPTAPFFEWLLAASVYWGVIVFCLVAAGLLLGFLMAVVGRGPRAGVARTVRVLLSGVADIARLSPRRVWTLARLTVQESIRRRVAVVVLAIFILVLLFGGWFLLNPDSPNPVYDYIDHVFVWTAFLVLFFASVVSAFSLPLDLRSRTLHTVVTKPVRPSEIVLGRMLGFALIGSGMLLVMGVVGCLFVVRGVAHTHTLEELHPVGKAARPGEPTAQAGRTSKDYGHRHQVYIDSTGAGRVEVERGHWHDLSVTGSGDQTRYEIGSAEGMLVARVPVYGKLAFRDRDGFNAVEGISTGDEDPYRSYIAGGTPAALIWTFDDIREETFPKEMPVEMTIGVFRTHKGDIEKGVLGSISVRNPKTGLTVEVEIFESKEFAAKKLTIPRKITKFAGRPDVIARKMDGPQGGVIFDPPPDQMDRSLAERRQFDLFEDLVDDGKLEIWVRCLEPGQYFGAAEPDLYLRAADAPFVLNFAKGYLGIWLQMVLLVAFGVMFSTFLSGPVAWIATLGVLAGGYFVGFMSDLARHQVHGGGPVEALVRLFKQENLVSDLGPGLWVKLVGMVDHVMEGGLRVISSLLPAFGDFSYAQHVAHGFNISSALVLERAVTALAFLVPVFVAGYLFLKTREVAR